MKRKRTGNAALRRGAVRKERKRNETRELLVATRRQALARSVPGLVPDLASLVLAYEVEVPEPPKTNAFFREPLPLHVDAPTKKVLVEQHPSLQTVRFLARCGQWDLAWSAFCTLDDAARPTLEEISEPESVRSGVKSEPVRPRPTWVISTHADDDGEAEFTPQFSCLPYALGEKQVLPFCLLLDTTLSRTSDRWNPTYKAHSFLLSVRGSYWNSMLPTCPELWGLVEGFHDDWSPMFQAVIATGESWRLTYLLSHARIICGQVWLWVLEFAPSAESRADMIQALVSMGRKPQREYFDPKTVLAWANEEIVRFVLGCSHLVTVPQKWAPYVFERNHAGYLDTFLTAFPPATLLATRASPGVRSIPPESVGNLLAFLRTGSLLKRELIRFRPFLNEKEVRTLLSETRCEEDWKGRISYLMEEELVHRYSLEHHAPSRGFGFHVLTALLQQWPGVGREKLARVADWSCPRVAQLLIDCGFPSQNHTSNERSRILEHASVGSALLLLETGILESKVAYGESDPWSKILCQAWSVPTTFPLRTHRALLLRLASFLPVEDHAFSLLGLAVDHETKVDPRLLAFFLRALPPNTIVQSLLSSFPPVFADALSPYLGVRPSPRKRECKPRRPSEEPPEDEE